MLKHTEIINKLTRKQKLSYLTTGILPQDDVFIPSINIVALENKALGEGCPPLNSIATSWSPRLFKRIGLFLANRAKSEGADLVVTPDIKISVNPYKPAMSEDPFLNGMLAAGLAEGINDTRLAPIFSSCSLNHDDIDFMDVFPNSSVLSDYIVKPFRIASSAAKAGGVAVSGAILNGKYDNVNIELDEILTNEGIPAIVQPFDLDLENIDEEELNIAVDRRLSLAFESQVRRETLDTLVKNAEDVSELCTEAAERSIVLLKNANDTLPLERGTKVAVVGPSDLAKESDELGFAGIFNRQENLIFQYMGHAEGYNLNSERNDAALAEAAALARTSDAVVLFLKPDVFARANSATRNSFKLPANQLAVLNALRKTSRKIIAVIVGSALLDISFVNECSAQLFLPCADKFGYNALLKILSGEINPSGKLTNTIYDNPDEFFDEFKKRKNLGRCNIGPFFGYRSYDATNGKIKYSFGHGLSYTKFSYSKIKVNQKGIELELTNSGQRAGLETVQAYVAKKSSAVIRPTKELKGFKTVYLEPGESKVINIDFNYEDFKVTDSADGKRKMENGEYTILVGASASDIRQVKNFVMQGENLVGKQERLSDYIDAESNILSGKYTLTAEKRNKKKSIFAVIFSTLLLLGVGAFDVIFGISVAGGSEFNWPPTIVILVSLHLILVPTAIALLVFAAKRRKRLGREAKEQTKAVKEIEIFGRPALEKLFFDEFPQKANQDQETDLNKEGINDRESFADLSEIDIPELSNNKLTLKVIAEQLAVHLSERGTTLEASAVRTILASMFSSRVITLLDADAAKTEKFIKNLCTFFGTYAYMDSIGFANDSVDFAATDTSATEIAPLSDFSDFEEAQKYLRVFDKSSLESAAALNALLDARQNKHSIYIAFVKDYGFPKCDLPPNLWFVVASPPKSFFGKMPEEFVATASVIDLQFRIGAEKEQKTLTDIPGFHQFLKLSEDSERVCTADEGLWKKLDKLEEFTNSCSPFRLSNKQWRAFEKFVSVYLACGGTVDEATDNLIATKLLPQILPLIKADVLTGGDFSITLENIVGEGKANLSLSILRHFRSGAKGV